MYAMVEIPSFLPRSPVPRDSRDPIREMLCEQIGGAHCGPQDDFCDKVKCLSSSTPKAAKTGHSGQPETESEGNVGARFPAAEFVLPTAHIVACRSAQCQVADGLQATGRAMQNLGIDVWEKTGLFPLTAPLLFFGDSVNQLGGWISAPTLAGAVVAGIGVTGPGKVATRSGAAKGVAGSIRGVNPLRSATNCVNCAIAADATLAGRAASALPSGPTSISVLEKMFGGRFVSVTGPGAIESQLLNAGAGARGIVFGSRGAGEVGHVFNAVNQNGVVRFLDGQIGGAASLEGYTSFSFLRTF
jgi:hypothetical protein